MKMPLFAIMPRFRRRKPEPAPSLAFVEAEAVDLATRDAKAAIPDEYFGTTRPPAEQRLRHLIDRALEAAAALRLPRLVKIVEQVTKASYDYAHAEARRIRFTALMRTWDRQRCAGDEARLASGKQRDPNDAGPLLPRTVGWVVLALVALGEIPLLRVAFELLDTSLLESIFLVVGAQAGLLAVAHILGTLLRRWSRSLGYRVAGIVVLVAVASLGTALGVLRTDRLVRDARVRTEAGVGIQVTGLATTREAETVPVSPTKATWMFVSLQAVYLVVAAGVGAGTDIRARSYGPTARYVYYAVRVKSATFTVTRTAATLRASAAALERDKAVAQAAARADLARGNAILALYYDTLVAHSPREKAAALAVLPAPAPVAVPAWHQALADLFPKITALAEPSFGIDCASCPLLSLGGAT